MMANDDIFDKIEAWLSGELPEAEARAFEAEIAADAALAAEVERHRRGQEALDRLAEQALQEDMARWRDTMEDLPAPPAEDAQPNKSSRDGWITGGLVVLNLLAALLLLWPKEKNASPLPVVPQQNVTPIAVTPVAETPKEEPPSSAEITAQLIAKAETNLSDMHDAILLQYGQTMGEEDDVSPDFEAGLKAFKANKFKAAQKELLKVQSIDLSHYPSAQEMLAFIYYKDKNYPKAIECYSIFARHSYDPVTDWRMLQFYLADYQNSKAAFWKKLAEIANPANHHRFQEDAKRLKRDLNKLGFK